MNERLGFTSDEASIAVSALRGYANLQEAMAQNLEENATEDFLEEYGATGLRLALDTLQNAAKLANSAADKILAW